MKYNRANLRETFTAAHRLVMRDHRARYVLATAYGYTITVAMPYKTHQDFFQVVESHVTKWTYDLRAGKYEATHEYLVAA